MGSTGRGRSSGRDPWMVQGTSRAEGIGALSVASLPGIQAVAGSLLQFRGHRSHSHVGGLLDGGEENPELRNEP